MEEDCNDRNIVVGRFKLKRHSKMYDLTVVEEEEDEEKNGEKQREKGNAPYILKR